MDATPDQPASDQEHEAMAQCIEAWHDGGSAAVEPVLARHPAIADRLRERLRKLERAGLLGPGDAEPTEIPEQLGEFKLLRRLGSGGMGVVFLAEQSTLQRTVALKLVRPEQRFFPGARARFRREVEAVARLGDAGIVPIFSVGEDQGIDFFAMEYVRGASLGDVLAAVHATPAAQLSGREFAVVAAARGELPVPEPLPALFDGTWVQACARIVARMARAAHHAHGRGVVHRDLKPNNAMVTPDGRVLLLDFGLAAADGSSRITRSGAVLGTLHYMAPEQLLDGAADERADVYALGVTAYELLGLRSPFQGESSERLRQAILHGQAPSLENVNVDVPRDLATIVAVAMDRDASRRYASAGELADDLERFLQHRPIAARPIGVGLRLLRWMQRHPAWATAAAMALVAAVATPFLVQWSREGVQQLARTNLTTAMQAIDAGLDGAKAPVLARTPGLDQERIRRVDEAQALVVRLHSENPDDVEVQRLFVKAMQRVAEFRRLTGDLESIPALLDRAEAVVRTMPDQKRQVTDLAALAIERATALSLGGKVVEAERLWQALVDAHAAADAASLDAALVWAIATAHNNLSRSAHARGALEVAEGHLRRSLELSTAVVAKPTGEWAMDEMHTRMNLATILRDRGQRDAAHEGYAAVRQGIADALARAPGDPELRQAEAKVVEAMAAMLEEDRKWSAAVPLREQGVAGMEALVASFPDRIGYLQELANVTHHLSQTLQMAGDATRSEVQARRAVELAERVCARSPDNPEPVSELAVYLRQHSGVLYKLQREDESTKVIQRAIDLQEGIVARRSDDLHYRLQAAMLSQEIALHHANRQQFDPARRALYRARDHYEFALGKGHQPTLDPRRMPQLLQVLLQIEFMCDDPDGAMRALARLQELRPVAAPRLREIGERTHLDGRADFQKLLREAEARK
ncbi:MAG: serine/threonine protein kinase [Planctomycetes bacterium]|nr:serine/threonine protein kinase [Planctomycetota bacterium]